MPISISTTSLDRPKPRLGSKHQNGITDPQWPLKTPSGMDDTEYDQLRGTVDRQGFLCVVAADIRARTLTELREVLKKVSEFAVHEMKTSPRKGHLPPLTLLPGSYRVTVTVGFGASLFGGIEGDDRFQMRSLKPRYLRMMPSFYGDAEGLSPRDTASDLLFAISSDHPYVNVAIARSIAHGYVDPRLAVKEIAQGFSRPDKREFLRFDDGIDNLSNWPDGDLDRLIYIGPRDIEPDWCVGGSYLVYRKIRENLPIWEHLRTEQQEEIIGRHKSSGLPLARQTEPRDPRVPVFPDPKDPRDGALTAHIRKVQPRRNYPDLLGVHDLDRRFLRRPYPYFKGLDSRGEVECGLLFLAFMKSIKQQFEWPVQIWQTNPDFPIPGTGVDALYANGIISTIGGGYYFCPPAPNGKTDFLGSVLFG